MFLARDQLQRLIRRAADLTDSEVRAELADVPLSLLDHTLAADEYYDVGGSPFAGALFLAPTAAQFTGIGVRNPLGSGVVATVRGFHKVVSAGGIAGNIRIVRPPTAATAVTGTTTQCVNVDSRKPAVASPLLLLSTSLAALPGALVHVMAQADLNPRYIELVLDEGSELWMFEDTVNIGAQCNFWGTYRPRPAQVIAQV